MKQLLLIGFLLLFTLATKSQNTNPNLDTLLAKQLGADDYGMKLYTFVVLKTGENKTTEKAFVDSCFAGHMANIHKLVETKKLIVAGPFAKNDAAFRGIFIFDVASKEEAEKLLEDDPAVASGILKAEIFTWYGSAALPTYLETSDKIWKSKP